MFKLVSDASITVAAVNRCLETHLFTINTILQFVRVHVEKSESFSHIEKHRGFVLAIKHNCVQHHNDTGSGQGKKKIEIRGIG